MIVYRIQRADGKWSMGGASTASPNAHKRETWWTDRIKRSKVWKRKSDLNCHLTNVRQYCERYFKCKLPTDWTVVEFERKETRQSTTRIGKSFKI